MEGHISDASPERISWDRPCERAVESHLLHALSPGVPFPHDDGGSEVCSSPCPSPRLWWVASSVPILKGRFLVMRQVRAPLPKSRDPAAHLVPTQLWDGATG